MTVVAPLVLIARPVAARRKSTESTVRAIEAGDRTVRTGLRRRDELGRVARALDELTERLEQLEAERTTFEAERTAMLSSVGHDLRTPLSALRASRGVGRWHRS
ncbi:MAG: HAMP domain-containing protein [Ilumatobacteraceae bacterium]